MPTNFQHSFSVAVKTVLWQSITKTMAEKSKHGIDLNRGGNWCLGVSLAPDDERTNKLLPV